MKNPFAFAILLVAIASAAYFVGIREGIRQERRGGVQRLRDLRTEVRHSEASGRYDLEFKDGYIYVNDKAMLVFNGDGGLDSVLEH